MGQARDEAGNIWETDAQGNPVRLISAGQQATPLGGPDPILPYKIRTEQGHAAAAPYAGPTAAANAKKAEADAAVAATIAQANAERARAEAAKSQAELEKLKAAQTQTDPKSAAYKALQGQIDHVFEIFRRNIQGGLPNPLWGHIPTSTNSGFDSAAQGLVNPYMQAFRVPGAGSQSDTELKQFIQANVPQPTDTDAAIQEKLGNIQRQLDAVVPPPAPPSAPPPAADAPPDQIALATSRQRDEVDPVLKAVGARVGEMLSKGEREGAILKYLRESGVDPNSTNVRDAFRYRRTPQFRQWQRQNPGAPYPLGPDFYTKQVPMSETRQMFNKAADTGPGGMGTAYGIAAANGLTGGYLNNLTPNPQMAQAGMDLMRGQHPIASLAGDMSGQGLLEMTAGRIPGAQGILASRWGRRAADAGYGAYSGSGENDDDRLSGALTGALTNFAFGAGGRSLVRGAGKAAKGVQNANLQLLHGEGIPLTLGRIARGSENELGRAIGGIEERAMGLPGLDAVIGTARQRGDKAFNAAAFRQLPGHSGATGAEGIAEGKQLVDTAYNFLNGTTLPIDAQFAGSQAGVRAAIPALPAFGGEIGKGLDQIDRAAASGALPGRDWQGALSGVRADRSSIAGQPFSRQAVGALGDVESNLLNLAQRQGPAGTLDSLNSANVLNGKFQTLASALDNGPAQKADELFSAGRLDDASRVNARNFGGRTASLSGNRPFYELASAGKAVMPNLTPDSGTAGRMLLVPLLAGAGGGAAGYLTGDDKGGDSLNGLGYGALAAAALSAPYSKTGQKGLQKLLLGKRPKELVDIGDFLLKRAKLGGIFGSAIGRDYVYQPELNQYGNP